MLSQKFKYTFSEAEIVKKVALGGRLTSYSTLAAGGFGLGYRRVVGDKLATGRVSGLTGIYLWDVISTDIHSAGG